jgi:hypothetical protein
MLFKQQAAIHILLIILGFLLTALFAYGHFIDGDVIQILQKAHLFVTQGVLTPYGNVSTSGASGATPGAFLTLATGGAMKIWFSPWSALALLALLHFLAYLMFYDVVKNFVSVKTWIFIPLLFWLNPWRLSEVFLWNPGYIFVAAALHMWSAFYLSKQRSFVFSLVHSLSIFLALQIHASFFILILMTFFLLWTRALKPHWTGAFSGILLGILSLVPYLLAGLEDPSLFPQPGSGDGKGFLFFGLVAVYPLLKGFWYWILFGSTIFQTHVFHQVHFQWLGEGSLVALLVGKAWLIIKYLVGVGGVALSFVVNYGFYQGHKNKLKIWKSRQQSSQEWLVYYCICAFWAALVATALSPTLPIYWHLLMVWPMALVPLILFINQTFESGSLLGSLRFKRYFLVLLVYFSLTNFFAAMGSKKHDIRQSFHELYFETCNKDCVIR